MRIWEWGVADAEFSEWHCSAMEFKTPFGPWGDTNSTTETNGDYNEEIPQIGSYGGGYLHHECLIWIELAQVKAKLGQVPILVVCNFVPLIDTLTPTATYPIKVHRMITVWDKGDVSNWEYDVSLSLNWYLDKQHIVRGQDMESTPAHETSFSHTISTGDHRENIPVTTIMQRALRDNIPFRMNLLSTISGDTDMRFHWNPPVVYSKRPYLFFAYLYPIEFYHDDGSGDLDLSSPVTDDPGDEYYLGEAEPGQTGPAVKCHIRNYSSATQQVEIFDDYPEYTTPISRVGTAQLDYVTMSDVAVSQKYTAIFYSATQFEVLAVAYRDNAISLHPQINADAAWRGAVGTNFTAPSGGLTIPSAAWQPGTATSDEYETGVRGNTTDTAWPADSNDQIEVTKDNGGVADATAWRPVLGFREETKDQVTVDATTKFFPTRRVNPTDWPAATKAFIMDETNINEGQVASVQEADIATPTFAGSGLDDITISGNYNGIWTDVLRVYIDATGTPDTFKWSIDDGATWEETGVDCSTTDILLQDGIYVRWAADTGHTIDVYWFSAVDSWGIELSGLTANSNVYNSGSRIGTTLPIRDVSASVFTTVDQASGVSESQPARLYVASTAGMSASQYVFIQSPNSPSTAETKIIDSVQAGSYIDLTTSMTEDYAEGDFVTIVGTGQAAFWARPVAEVTTAEELKRLRFNARLL